MYGRKPKVTRTDTQLAPEARACARTRVVGRKNSSFTDPRDQGLSWTAMNHAVPDRWISELDPEIETGS
jgi:hypothetical protein